MLWLASYVKPDSEAVSKRSSKGLKSGKDDESRASPTFAFALEPPMWTRDTRLEHDRDDLRYPSDVTGAEWAILEPLLPPPSNTGRKRGWPMREVINAIFFVLRGGCPWRMLPEHFPAIKPPMPGSPASATTAPGKPSTIIC